jgi:single-strand DNA-binding protein
MSINKVILIGRLGADPELRYTLEGKPVVTMRIATNEVIIRQNGDKETHTEWHRIVVFGKLAEICGEYLETGSQIYVEGLLRYRKILDRSGFTRIIPEILAETIKFLSKPASKDHPSSYQESPTSTQSTSSDLPLNYSSDDFVTQDPRLLLADDADDLPF